MYPKPIEFYFAPGSLDETLRLLGEHRGRAKLLAGGQSLIPLLKLRLAEPRCLIDLNRVPGLAEVREFDDALCLGPMIRHADVATHPLIISRYPLLAEAARVIGDPQIRNRGTLGGSLAHADPGADYPAAMLALDAQLALSHADGGKRMLLADQFFMGPMTTAMSGNELLTEVRLPKPDAYSGGAYAKHSLVAGDFALVSVAVQLASDAQGQCERAAIVIGGLQSRPAYAKKAAQLLLGTALDDKICRQAGEIAAKEVEAHSDTRASEVYRENLIRSYVPVTIRRAAERLRDLRQ